MSKATLRSAKRTVRCLPPPGPKVRGGLHVVGASAAFLTAKHELASVVRVLAADDDNHLHALEQVLEGSLMVFGWMADGVGKVNLGGRVLGANRLFDRRGVLLGRGGLAHDAQPRVWIGAHFVDRLNHLELVQVLDDALDFDVPPFADHQHEAAFAL